MISIGSIRNFAFLFCSEPLKLWFIKFYWELQKYFANARHRMSFNSGKAKNKRFHGSIQMLLNLCSGYFHWLYRTTFQYRELLFKINLKLRTWLNSSRNVQIAPLSTSADDRCQIQFAARIGLSNEWRNLCRIVEDLSSTLEMNIFPFSMNSHNLCIWMWTSGEHLPFGANKIKFTQVFRCLYFASVTSFAINDSMKSLHMRVEAGADSCSANQEWNI